MKKKNLILVSGKLQSGKNTFSNLLKCEIESRYRKKVAMDSFASSLKSNCFQDFSNIVSLFKKEHEKLVSKGYDAEDIKWMDIGEMNFYEDKTDFTRLLLQIYGTDIFRKRVDDLYWIKDFETRVNKSKSSFVLVTDVRFKNEINYFQKQYEENPETYSIKPFRIRVERSDIPREDIQNSHISERDLDDYDDWDYVINNDGTLDDLLLLATDLSSYLIDEGIAE